MPRPTLPAACHWAGTEDAPLLMFNYRVVAIINPPERGQPAYLCLMWGGKTIVVNHSGSMAQAKRHIERWVAAQAGLPGQRRANKRLYGTTPRPDPTVLAAIDRTMRW